MTQLHINLVWSTVRSTLLKHGISSSNQLNRAIELNLRGDYTLGTFHDSVLLKIQRDIIEYIKYLIDFEQKEKRSQLATQQPHVESHQATTPHTPTTTSCHNKKLSAPQGVRVKKYRRNICYLRQSVSALLNPYCMRRLSSQRNTRPGNCCTRLILCVAMITAVPLAEISCRWCTICSLVSGSRFPVGSSARINRGLFSNARAITMRCCSPPDSS